MIIYEVNLHVDAIAADEYSEWLGPHIEQIFNKVFKIGEIQEYTYKHLDTAIKFLRILGRNQLRSII